jgi:hypothetical protein
MVLTLILPESLADLMPIRVARKDYPSAASWWGSGQNPSLRPDSVSA